MERFDLSEIQANAILEMRLRRLTGLERDKIENEYQELLIQIADLKDILANHSRVVQIIRDELTEVKIVLVMNVVQKSVKLTSICRMKI